MKLLAAVAVAVGAVGICSLAGAARPAVLQSSYIDIAQRDFAENQGLGERLNGQPASARQVAEARRLVQDGLFRAREVLRKYPQYPASHHLVGSLLCLAYYPTPARRVRTEPGTGMLRDQHVTVLLRGNPDRARQQEGLAQLRAAFEMSIPGAPYRTDYHLDYAEALLLAGETPEALAELNRGQSPQAAFGPLTEDQQVREARLYARVMRTLDRPSEEAYWWQQVLDLRPQDPEATAGLAAATAKA